ncbi:MAG: C40 family peptidase [Burkholderiales bacterium]
MYSARLLLALWLAMAFGPATADEAPSVTAVTAVAPESAAERYFGKARELTLQAMGFLGIRYRYGGATPESGFDCSGLVGYVFSQVAGLALPRKAREIGKLGEKVARDELQPGDLVFFNTLRHPFSHVGIYLGEHRFIHAPGRGGEVEISELTSRYWQKRYNGARRIAY